MNGQLSEQPLAELIREISSKSFGGRLRLEQDRAKVVAYFELGQLVYAAANLRTLRLREYLEKSAVVSESDLERFNERLSDLDLLKELRAQGLVSAAVAAQVQSKQVADVLRLALSWTDGLWEFDARSRLEEQLEIKIDVTSLLLEAGRRLPADFTATRFPDETEMLTPLNEPLINDSLLPEEVFLLSRVDQPMRVRDVVAISGLKEAQTLQRVYSLTLAGLLGRERWQDAFRGRQSTAQPPTPLEKPAPTPAPPPPPAKVEPSPELEVEDVEAFLDRIKAAQTYYEVLGVNAEASAESLKMVYYQLARRYHPDRFRKADASLLARSESAFARITQAYETLRDDRLRASYNSKLAHRRKAEKLAESAPKATAPASQPEAVTERVAGPTSSAAERAERQFKEGFAALELGQQKVALGLFASAASTAPNEPRYRAFYGQMLAGHEQTRRAAETEFLAAVKLDPKNAEYRVMLAELYRDLGLKLRAKGEAERAVAADPNNRKARDLLQTLK